MTTTAATDQLMDFYGLIRGKYLTAEVRYLSTHHSINAAIHYQDEHGVLVDVYSLADWRWRSGDNWVAISEYLQRFFPEDLSQYAVVNLVVGSRQVDQVAASFGLATDTILRKYNQYIHDRAEALKSEGEGIQGFFDALAFYHGNAVQHSNRYVIARSKLDVISRDFEVVFDDLRPNIYDAQDLFQQLPISEEFPFAILLNYNTDQQLRVNDQFHDWSVAAQGRIQTTIERARTYLQKKAKRLGDIIDARWERTVDAFQIDHGRFPRLDQQLRAFIAVGLRSDWKRNVDLIIFKIGETRVPLIGRVSFPNAVQPDLEHIQQLMDQQLFPTNQRLYHVHRYRGSVSYFGLQANPHLFPFLLINPLNNVWRLDESRNLLSSRQKVSYMYRNVDNSIGFGVQVRVSWTQQSRLPSEQKVTDHYGTELTFPAGTPITTFNFVRGRRVDHLERVANQLQLLLIGQQLLEYQITHPEYPLNLLQYDSLNQSPPITRVAMEEVVEKWNELVRWGQWFRQRFPNESIIDVKPATGHFTIRHEQRIDRLRQIAPDIIDEKYPERCTGKKQPDVVPYRRHQFRSNDERVVHLPIDDPQYSFICTSPRYPYATLVYADQNVHPCCSEQSSKDQIARAIESYYNQDPSARTRQTTIKPLEYNGVGIVPDRLRKLHDLSRGRTMIATELVRVGVDKRNNFLSAAYFSLTGRHLTDAERGELMSIATQVQPSLLAEQNWSDPHQALNDAMSQMTYHEHFRLVMEVLRQFTGRSFNLLAISGGRDSFTFVYPNYHRTLTWRPNPEWPTAVVYTHTGPTYDAVAVKSLLSIMPYNAHELVQLFNQTIRLMSPVVDRTPYKHYLQREIPDNIIVVGQQLDHEGHQVAVAGRWPNGDETDVDHDDTIYYFLTTPRPPDNVPTFNTFNQAPTLEQLQNRLDREPQADSADRELITTVNFKRQPLWSEVIGYRQGNWYLIGTPWKEVPVDPRPTTTVILPIAYTSDLANVSHQLLDIYYTATWLKHLLNQLLQLYRRDDQRDDVMAVIGSFLDRYVMVVDGPVTYPDHQQLASLEITPTTTVDEALDQLAQRVNASFVVDGRLVVARSVYLKLPEFCRRTFYAVPRAELRPPNHKSQRILQGRGLWFNQQTTLDLNELRIQIHSQLPKTGTYIYIRVAADNAVYAIRRYDSYDSYIMEHPNLYHQVIKFQQWSYTNESLTYKDAKNHRYPPTTYSLSDAKPDLTMDAIITDGPIYLFVERYYQV